MPCNVRVRLDNTNVVRVDTMILRRVAERFAVSGKGRIVGTALDRYTGREIQSDCGIAIRTLDMPNGVALHTNGGQRLSFEGDPYQAGYQKTINDLPNAYVDEVIGTVLRSLSFAIAKSTPTAKGIEYEAVDLAGRVLKILRQNDGKIKFDYGDGFDDQAYHETSDAIKKALANIGVETETAWEQPEEPEKWLQRRAAVLGKEN